GTNIRDHFNGSFNNFIAPGAPSATFGSDRLDEQTFVLPASFAGDTLTDIIVTGHGGNPQGEAFLAAVTVLTAGGAAVPGTLGIASGPPNSATVTVPSSVAPYPDLQIANLAVTPSTGLQSGAGLVVQWNDVNTGNGATKTSWDDQVVLKNTTTGV